MPQNDMQVVSSSGYLNKPTAAIPIAVSGLCVAQFGGFFTWWFVRALYFCWAPDLPKPHELPGLIGDLRNERRLPLRSADFKLLHRRVKRINKLRNLLPSSGHDFQ